MTAKQLLTQLASLIEIECMLCFIGKHYILVMFHLNYMYDPLVKIKCNIYTDAALDSPSLNLISCVTVIQDHLLCSILIKSNAKLSIPLHPYICP